MKYLIILVLTSFILLSSIGFTVEEDSLASKNSLACFKAHASVFASEIKVLKQLTDKIKDAEPQTITDVKYALKRCRAEYKYIEFFLEYFFPNQALLYNAPAKLEIEEPFLEYDEARGLQVIEALIYEEDPSKRKDEIMDQVNLIYDSAIDLHSIIFNFKASDEQLLESLRIEILRVLTLSIVGYDAPLLKSGIEESHISLVSVKENLKPFLNNNYVGSAAISLLLEKALARLNIKTEFDDFDRLEFLTEVGLPLQQGIGKFISENKLELNTNRVLNYNSKNIFSPNAFNKDAFTPDGKGVSPDIALVGKLLFSENALSGNRKMSCASCHNPDNYFMDALPKSLAADEHSFVKRNAPSLFFTGFQYRQFWDGRANTLEEQVKDVLANTSEMNSGIDAINRIKNIPAYKLAFAKSFPGEDIKVENVVKSISSYIYTLAPFNSPFDKYIDGNKEALTIDQKKGFNLFMGKAQCATCHFAPLFNGLIPPAYTRTEFENIGTPASEDLEQAREDEDMGRYNVYNVDFYKRSFKTPGLRNIEKTGPYMHNGSFNTLEKVMDFYNQGGGNGIGFKLDNQTLPSNPLNLSPKEIIQIISFLNSLTSLPVNTHNLNNDL